MSKVIDERILPWFGAGGVNHLVFAKPHFSEKDLPAGTHFTRRKSLGKAVRRRGQVEDVVAHWPQDDMQALRYPTLFFIYEGEADILLGDIILHCPTKYGALIPSGVPQGKGRTPHWLRPKLEKAQSDILWVHLRSYGAMCHLSHTLSGQHTSDYGRQSVIVNNRLLPLAENLVQEMEERHPRFEAIASAYLMAFLNILMRALDHKETHGTVRGLLEIDTEHHNMSDVELIVRRAQDYIENHFVHRLTLQDIAHASYISRAHLAQVFREKLGQTVWEYVTSRRLQEAKMLLEETSLPISRVSQFSGFGQPSTFYAQFSKLTGLSPDQYRRLAKGRND